MQAAPPSPGAAAAAIGPSVASAGALEQTDQRTSESPQIAAVEEETGHFGSETDLCCACGTPVFRREGREAWSCCFNGESGLCGHVMCIVCRREAENHYGIDVLDQCLCHMGTETGSSAGEGGARRPGGESELLGKMVQVLELQQKQMESSPKRGNMAPQQVR